MEKSTSRIPALLKKDEKELLAEWLTQLNSGSTGGAGRISEGELQTQAKEFLGLLQEGTRHGNLSDVPTLTPSIDGR